MTVYQAPLGAGRSFVELEQCAVECEKLRAQVDALAAEIVAAKAENADRAAEIEHLRAALWLAQHPGQPYYEGRPVRYIEGE